MGFKTFAALEVLTAEDVNDYLMEQVVARYADEAARDAVVPIPPEGMLCYVVGDGLQIGLAGAWTTVPTTPPATSDYPFQAVPRYESTAARDTAIPTPVNGQLAWTAATGVTIHNGTAWVKFPPATVDQYSSTAGQVMGIGWQRLLYNTSANANWTFSTVSGGTVFTCTTAGLYTMTASVQHSSNIEHAFAIGHGTTFASGQIPYAWAGGSYANFGATITAERQFAVADTFAVWKFSGAGSVVLSSNYGTPWVRIRRIA